MKIYRIFSEIGDCCYVGKTESRLLSKRLAQHKYNYINKIGACSCWDVLKYNDFKIELVETLGDSVNSKEREKYHINNYENTVNKYLKNDFSKKDNKSIRSFYI